MPGTRLKNLAERNRVFRIALSHVHLLEIIDDHQHMWLEASNEAERHDVEARYRRQASLAVGHAVGIEVALAGGLDLVLHPVFGFGLLVVGAIIAHLTFRGR
jgi:hypothetical protein